MSRSRIQFFGIFKKLKQFGVISKPRGLTVLEETNFQYQLSPFVRFCSFDARKLNLEYIKREFLWYLRGNEFDTSITRHASMWKKLINVDGSINSNYGQYIFGQHQFQRVVNTLKNDPDSRRAVIIILNQHHLDMVTPDIPCTYSINFHIRKGMLNMTVHMRSQDVIFGMGNDAPCFSFIHEMMWQALRRYYPLLQYGWYSHYVDSFHVYERHFNIFNEICKLGSRWSEVECPAISGPDEVDFLINCDFTKTPREYAFTRWLTNQYE